MPQLLNRPPSKMVDVVEVTLQVPQTQLNNLRQMYIKYILDNNNEELAFKLLNLSTTKLRDDIKIFN